MPYAPTFPVSIKGVVIRDGGVLLLRSERDERELPGGRLERAEDPPARLAQEISEEAGWKATVGLFAEDEIARSSTGSNDSGNPRDGPCDAWRARRPRKEPFLNGA
ncbi:NUDIX domain-containing protein [Nonomuraea sp. NPDC050790]|uniref:NUDIX domain-containing protein n=1 Tax=Nonomuraea sp. NPDC050790 TaxID=3364371 RepID=UPI003794C219